VAGPIVIKQLGEKTEMSNLWEVFNPKDGKVFYRTRYVKLAKAVAWACNADYARQGEGWN
jgi:hypothetical protein